MIHTKTKAKTIREQLIEKAYLKRVDFIRQHYNFAPRIVDILSCYEEVIDRLEIVALNLDTIQPQEELYSLTIYMNGIFVYEYDFNTNGMVDAVPEDLNNVEVYEIVLNDKLAVLTLKDEILLNRLEPHYKVVEKLRESTVWNQLTGNV